MKSFSRFLILLLISILLVSGNSNAQKKYRFPKPPKFTLTFALSYNYALSKAFGNLSSFSSVYDSTANGYVFNAPSYGMLQGGGFLATGKWGVGKKRQVRHMFASLGYRVLGLKRIRIDVLTIDGLSSGDTRELTSEEIQSLKKE